MGWNTGGEAPEIFLDIGILKLVDFGLLILSKLRNYGNLKG